MLCLDMMSPAFPSHDIYHLHRLRSLHMSSIHNKTAPTVNTCRTMCLGGMGCDYRRFLDVNDLSKKLNTSMVGLHMCNICINHIFYADDLCIMSSSPAGLQMLLNICASYALENGIVFNHKKSMYTVFKPDKFKLACPDIFIDGSPLTMVENAKYL